MLHYKSMKIDFEKYSTGKNTPESTEAALLECLKKRARDHPVIYVAGPVSADGDAKIAQNIAKLEKYCNELAAQLPNAYIFTSSHVLAHPVYEQLGLQKMDRSKREATIQQLFDRILESRFVSKIYFAPGWERSTGAQREYQVAAQHGIPVRFLST